MFSCSDKTSKTKRLTDDLTAGLVASHSLSGNMSRHRLCSQSTSLPSSRPSSNILKKCQFEFLPCFLSMLATQSKLTEHFPGSTSSCRDLWRINQFLFQGLRVHSLQTGTNANLNYCSVYFEWWPLSQSQPNLQAGSSPPWRSCWELNVSSTKV